MRQLLVQQIDPQACPTQGLSTFNKVICLAILLSTLLAIIETEPVLATNWPQLFWWANLAFLLLFSAELALRIYIAPYTQAHLGQSRWRFLRSGWTLLDLLVLLCRYQKNCRCW
ncbi:ion transporter [Alishewanella sp. HH-ZS]|jgi:voltage-gated potassium channel|uniref:ion transporter n=1 Tax=Alishewanella sp. HH-ZS TaxID=1856684 RepID=UPI0021015C51|nr:ion transporter [Alishewanella sp. HH-ZS]